MTAYLIAALAGLISLIAVYARGRVVGAKLERTANNAKEAEANAKELQDVAAAGAARADADRLNADAGKLRQPDAYKRK
ncbi:hypothetical protein [Pseudaminobacter salicylatoxidans]|uniref:hypothetical protein n=1 Tax=Pseudaminobacter salicylatoxidans TaxID=93369 RepID=UPI0011B2857C|nr:hypothetical protein [Pseudaminobacter salicylatoxidans]